MSPPRVCLCIAAFLAALALWLWRPVDRDARVSSVPVLNAPPGSRPPPPDAVGAVASTPGGSSSPLLAPADSSLGRFQAWTQRYLAAAPAERAGLIAEGVRLATERRADFKHLIVQAPREALRQAVPMVDRQRLPAEVVAQLEERVSGRAQLRIYLSNPGDGPSTQPPVMRFAEFAEGVTYEAHVFGRRAVSVQWLPNAALHGVAIDRHLAVSESPLRRLEVGEIPPAEKAAVEICPVSGRTTLATAPTAAVDESVVAVEVYDEIVYLCDGSHVTFFEEQLIQGEGATGGPQRLTGILPASPSPSLGELRVLYIPMTFADQGRLPASEARSYEVMRDVADFFYKSSFGRLTCQATVSPPITLPHNEAWYVQKDTSDGVSKEIDGLGLEHQHAREEARKLGYDSNDYDAVVVRLSGGPRATGGWGGGSTVWVYSDSPNIVAHELGHCFALAHANFWDTGGASAIGPGGNQEYGNPFDVMGGGPFPKNHYNAQAKNQIKWLPNDFVQTVTRSGIYRVHAFDQVRLDPAKRYALKIAKDNQRTYWGEVRAQYDADNRWIANGLLLGWKWPTNSGGNIQLIDTTPQSPGAKNDAPIVVGQTFSDFESDIHLAVLAVNTDENGERSVDVRVTLDGAVGNLPPTLSLAASALNVPAGAPVSFTATAADPNGDPLAYQWLSSDNTSATTATIGPNAPVFTRSFSTAGQYVVTCIASDGRGGRAIRYVLVTVGNGNARFAISGRVSLDGQGLAGVYVSTGTANGVPTDSSGYFTIPNLAAGTYTVSPLLYGYTFTDLFNNGVLVGPNFSGANFAAEVVPTVAIAASGPVAFEAGATAGKFTLTRTGPDADPLTVNLVPAFGTATLTTDYTFSPALTTGTPYNTVVIPAGQSSLDVLVTPVNDALSEGPETVVLQLGLSAAYVIAGQPAATVTINDDDTALPRVSITADTLAARENPVRPATFTLTRTGPTNATLTVNLAFSGRATAGADYATPPTSVTFPVGSATATLTITPLDDAIAEDFETVVATITSNAAYLVDSTAASATITIEDDDQQVVSLVVADAVATEVNLALQGAVPDPGTFVATRTGDISQPLTVYYALAGTALHGVDYEPLPGSITFPAGQARASIVITPRFDGVGEAAETVLLQLAAGGPAYRLGPVSSGSVTINDAGDPAYVEVIPMAVAREPATAGRFRFTLKSNGTAAVTVNYTVGGTATPGTDYTALPGSVTIPAGANSFVDVNVTPINDTEVEELETVTVTITPSSAYQTWEASRSATLWLYDDEQPTVFVDAHTTASSGLATLAESSAAAGKFYLSRTGSTTDALTVNYVMSGTATNGVDYQLLSGTATIPAGQPGVDVPVTPSQDTLAEGTETIVLTLAAGAYGRGPAATLYLTDDEVPAVSVGFAAPSSVVSEAAGTISVPVNLSAASTSPVTVEYAVTSAGTGSGTTLSATTSTPYWIRLSRSGHTFTAWRSADNATWTPFSTTTTLALSDPIWVGFAVCSVVDGSLATATFDNVSLSPASVETWSGRDLGFVSAAGSASESGGVYTVSGSGAAIGGTADAGYYYGRQVAGDFVFTARVLTSTGTSSSRLAGLMAREDFRRNARNVFVAQRGTTTTISQARTNVAMSATGSGVDFKFTPGQLTFLPGVTSLSVPLTIIDDALAEPNEQIVMILRNANGAALGTSQHVIAIDDNDTSPLQPSIGFAASATTVAEGETPAIAVTLSTPAATTVSVNYAVTAATATAGADFVLPPGVLSFLPGETTKILPLTILDDSEIEGPESLVITLSSPVGATLTTLAAHAVSITDNDLPMVTVVATDPNAAENGDAGLWTFTRTGSTAAALTVSYTLGGTATNGTDYATLGSMVTIAAGASTATVVLAPIADAAAETAETAVLTLASQAGYTIGTPSAATITIADTNTPVVTVVATDADASETGPNPGVFTFSRTGATASALTVAFATTGTATAGTDYTAIGSSVTIPAGQSSATVTISPINDTLTEGPEYVVLSVTASAGYAVGTANFASVTIADNDTPPAVVVAQPAAKSVQLASGVGLHLAATATDDGAPSPLVYSWSKFSGPGVVTFGAANSATTTATFSANGLYILRISVTDGQFTVSDDITVQVGGFAAANWIDMSLGAPATRGASSDVGGVMSVVGSGTGFAATTDSGHFVCRQLNGTSSVVARLTGLGAGASTGALAGVMMRETSYRGARRALLALKNTGAVEWHTRSAVGGSDTTVSGGTVAFPAWLKLERAGDTITAYRAADASGAPGTWTVVGSPLVLTTLGTNIDVGLAATNAVVNTVIPATFDNVALTPAPVGPALVSEDVGTGLLAGSSSVSGSTYTLAGSGTLGDSGHFRFQQYVGDLVITARILNHTGSGFSAKGGVMIRDTSLDLSPYGMMGIAHYWGGYFAWRNVVGGSASTNYGGSTANPQWIRLVREGDSLTAWKAVNATGNVPGAWVKQGATQIFSAGAPIHVGLAADANSGSAVNTVQLDSLTITPGNLAPVVNAGPGGTLNGVATVSIDATVTDDGQPNPPGAFAVQWSTVSGPGTVTFGSPNSVDTTAQFSGPGTYVLRLSATDGEVGVFAETTYVVGAVASPTVATQPVPQQVEAGGAFTLSVVVAGNGPFTYQWLKDGNAIAGATASSLAVAGAQVGQAGVYAVVIANGSGSVTSDAVPVGVIPAGTSIAQSAVGNSYLAGSPLTIANTVIYPGAAAGLEWRVALPAGWSLASDNTSGTTARPAVGATGVVTWRWAAVPASPFSFSYTLNVPAGQTGNKLIAAPVNLQLAGPALQLLARPDPLILVPALHSADTDRNLRISLAELTRVIELYNTRNGSSRTGAYKLDAAGEDGFAPEATRAATTEVTLASYHTADTDHNGRLSVLELTRVIELFNFRSGSVRTGQYHLRRDLEPASEDGFYPGP